jgi:ATP-dependent RNA helicase DeaD
MEQLKIWLGRGRYQREREMVAKLVEEGIEPLEIAAAALKLARAGEKQRPVTTVVELQETTRPPRGGDREFVRGSSRVTGRRGQASSSESYTRVAGFRSHEAGMVRLKLNKGKEHGVRPNDIVGTIAHHADIPGNSIGKIRIEEKITFVDVPENLIEKILKHNGNYRIGKDKFNLVKA